MQTIDMIKNDTKDSKWIVDQFKNDLLYVDDSFQRRYVWHEKHKIQLIETILLGYAIPEIYLWDVSTDPESGDTKRSIVDGQQRIGAVVSFIQNEFKLKNAFLVNKDAEYAGAYFNELPAELKSKIWKYPFTFRIVMEEVAREDIVKMFLRLNSTDKSLNPQELRNAEFNGLFLKTALEISNFDFWTKYRIFSADSIRRMSDIEFISSLLIFLRFGIASEVTQKKINEAYDYFEEEYDEAVSDKKTVANILAEIEKLITCDSCILPYLRKTSHLYTISIVVYKALMMGDGLSSMQCEKLIEFYKDYDEREDTLLIEYKGLISGATRSKNSRMRRNEILCDYVGV